MGLAIFSSKKMRYGSLVAVFVHKDKTEEFTDAMINGIQGDINHVRVYEVDGNDSEYLVTFKYLSREDIDLKDYFKNITAVHVKNGCIFTINALNHLIEKLAGDSNVNKKKYEVNWNDYKDTLILMKNNELTVSKIRLLDCDISCF